MQKHSRKLFWNVFDILLFSIYFAAVGFIYYCLQGKILYLDGLNGTHTGTKLYFYAFLTLLLTAALFPVVILRVYFWKLSFVKIKRSLLLRSATVAIVCIATSIFAVIPSFLGPPRYVFFTEGYRDWARQSLDVKEIRAWISTVDEKGPFSVDEDFKGPRCIKEQSTRFDAGIFSEDENGQMSLKLHSGGGFQDWGVFIGLEETDISPFETVMYDAYSGEYRLRLEEGAYVWYELQ